MQELQQIEQHVYHRDIKKADILIARLFKSQLSAEDLSKLYLFRARTRLLSGRPEDAIDDVSAAEKTIPLDQTTQPTSLEIQGDAYFARFELASVGFVDRIDTVRAESTYEKLLNQFPNYKNIGWIYFQKGRIKLTEMKIDEAEELFERALVSPSYLRYLPAYCYERLGFIAYYERRDWSRSLDFLDRALNTYPHDEDNHWLVQVQILRSRVYKMLGKPDLAIKASEAALKIASGPQLEKRSLSEAILNIIELLSDLNGHEREILNYLDQFTQHTKKPLGVDVTWSRLYEIRGNTHLAIGKYDEAIADYKNALQFNPDHPWELFIYQQIARCYYQNREYTETINVINRLLQNSAQEKQTIKDFRVFDMLGSALFALKRYQEAVIAYQSALSIVPPNTDLSHKIQSYYDLARELI
ncbi:MAG: DUF3808 domain-containing protein [Chloroflexi bacterium]|nr:DUF3808 domain-containing protein [Chloroflexota bacterium]MCC6891294.1 DUF3808 domain-containing protein [Anaerolineae bacterium]